MSDIEDFLAMMEREDKEFLNLIDSAEDGDLYGVLDLNGAAGNSFKPTHGAERTRFTFAAWKFRDHTVQTDELYVEMFLENGPQKPIYPYRLIHVRARLAQHPCGELRGWVSEIVNDNYENDELRALIPELKAPVTIDDPQLGHFKLNRSVGWFEGALNEEVEMCVQAKSVKKMLSLLPATRLIVNNLTHWIEESKKLAVTELLDTYNSGWRESYEPILDEIQFKDLLQLTSISIYDCGDHFQLIFDAQGLFTDHSICVPCSKKDGCIEAKI